MILSRYLIQIFLKWFSLIGGVVFCFIFLFDFTELQRRVGSQHSVSMLTKINIVLLKIPSFLQELLPFFAFFASLGLFWQLSRSRELIVLRTSGLSVWRFLSPIAGVALVIAALDLFLFQPLSTRMIRAQQKTSLSLSHKNGGSRAQILPSGIWLKKKYRNGQLIYHVRGRSEDTKELSIFLLSPRHKILRHYEAGDFKTGYPLELRHVLVTKEGEQPFYKEKIKVPFSLTDNDIYNSQPDPRAVSFWSFPGLIALIEKAGMSTHKYILQWHNLWAHSFWLWAMACLGAVFSLRSPRHRSNSLLIAGGALSCFFFYFLRDFIQALGASGSVPVWFAAWSPFFLTCCLALSLLIHLEEGR